MDISGKAQLSERFALGPGSLRLLSAAERRMGELAILGRLWPPWPAFAQGTLVCLAAWREVMRRGLSLDLPDLLAIPPGNEPSRPGKPLRWGLGLASGFRRLAFSSDPGPLGKADILAVYQGLDSPHLSRGGASIDLDPSAGLPGAPAWTLAGRWLDMGLPSLSAAALTLAAWEKEGPRDNRRRSAGFVLLAGLAPRLGLPPECFLFIPQTLPQAAAHLEGGWNRLMDEVKKSGSWKLWMGVFFRAAEESAGMAVDLAVQAKTLLDEHGELVRTWVRAPRHPLRLLNLLAVHPIMDIPTAAKGLEVTQRTAGLLVGKLTELGLLKEMTGQKRGRRYSYDALLEILDPEGHAEENEG